MITQLFAAFILDSLRDGALWTKNQTVMRELASPTHRSTALHARQPGEVVRAFVAHLAQDQHLWSSSAPEKPTSAYALALSHALRPGPLHFRRAVQLQRAAATVLSRAGITVPEIHIATAVSLPANGPRIVTVRRALLGGARIVSNGALRDHSWLGALRNLFSV